MALVIKSKHSTGARYMTLTYFKIIDKNCQDICIIYHTSQDEKHKRQVCFNNGIQNHLLANLDMMSMERGVLVFTSRNTIGVNQYSHCEIMIQEKPFVSMLLAQNFIYAADFNSLNLGTFGIYIHIRLIPKMRSYADAKMICKKLGSDLVSLDSLEEVSLVKNILLGSRFDDKSYPHPSMLRIYPFSGLYLHKKISTMFQCLHVFFTYHNHLIISLQFCIYKTRKN